MRSPGGLALWWAATALAADPLRAQAIALVGAVVLDGTGGPAIEDAVVIVRGERIACVGRVAQCPVPAGARRVELPGRVLAEDPRSSARAFRSRTHVMRGGRLYSQPALAQRSAPQ
ncbi:MAG: hypothetical protein ACT4PM_06130 [Gemmatimonadales bacterium]